MLRRDQRDRLAEVADAVDRQHRLVTKLEAVALLSRDVLVRQHGVHARHSERARHVDRVDAGVCVRAPHRVAPEHARFMQIARVRELAGDLRDRVLAQQALADPAEHDLLRRRAHRDAASRTASKIFA